MRIKTVFIIIMAFAFLLQAPIYTVSAVPSQNIKTKSFKDKKGTWLWNAELIKTQPEEILDNLRIFKIKEVYVNIDECVQTQYYQNFVEQASAQGITVYALGGSPNWVLEEQNEQLSAFIQWVEEYQQGATLSQRFRGVHLDIEPYLLKQWESQRKETILRYQKTVLYVISSLKNSGLEIAFDIPFWFDEIGYDNEYGKGNLAQWLLQNVKTICIMAYRDEARGKNNIIDVVSNEMKWAKEYNHQIIIALETGKVSETERVTFCEEGMRVLNKETLAVYNYYKNHRVDFSFALHHYQSLIEIKP
jgi:hypothetical protein